MLGGNKFIKAQMRLIFVILEKIQIKKRTGVVTKKNRIIGKLAIKSAKLEVTPGGSNWQKALYCFKTSAITDIVHHAKRKIVDNLVFETPTKKNTTSGISIPSSAGKKSLKMSPNGNTKR